MSNRNSFFSFSASFIRHSGRKIIQGLFVYGRRLLDFTVLSGEHFATPRKTHEIKGLRFSFLKWCHETAIFLAALTILCAGCAS
jgi:hypothetical protein